MGLRRRNVPSPQLSAQAVSNALAVPPLPLQQAVTDERNLLTVPWTLLLQGIEQTIAEPTYLEGTHADRKDPDSDAANFRLGTYFYENDRKVLYQSRLVPLTDPAHPTNPPVPTPCWVYVSGTMSGTLASRPTDLGKPSWTNHHDDTGFRFHATDTNQDYLWNGTAWVDITGYRYVMYGTHAGRLALSLTGMADGMLWCEIDRNNVVYQLQSGIWWYVAGTMYGTMVPDQRPIDLGIHDGGFDFRSTDLPARQFLWSQTAWVEVTPPSQTPWTTDIDGAGHALNNTGALNTTGNVSANGVGIFRTGLIGTCVGGPFFDTTWPSTGAWYTIAPSNTQFIIRMRGSDGVWRQATLTLT